MPKEKIGVLCSGRGSNLASIIDAMERGDIRAEIAVVLADKADAYALTRAREHGIPDVAVVRKAYAAREDFERALLEQLHAHGVTLVVLAGFMRILSPLFVRAYAGRILNIHPALLPSFPGAHAHRDAVPVAEGDTEDSLAARVLKEEHRIFPAAIRLYVDGRLRTDGRQVHILPPAEGGAL